MSDSRGLGGLGLAQPHDDWQLCLGHPAPGLDQPYASGILRNSSRASLSYAAAVSMVAVIASAAGKSTEGLLVMPGCPPWVAALVPFFCASIGGGLAWLIAGCVGWRWLMDHFVGICSWASVIGRASTVVWGFVKPPSCLCTVSPDTRRRETRLKTLSR